MKVIERFKARIGTGNSGRKFADWDEWKDCDGTQGLTQSECETMLAQWGYHKRTDDARIWQLVDMIGASQHQIVADNFDVQSYNAALKD